MNKDFFIINGYPLDDNQINAIVKARTHSLIVAGAGSGKTLTMIGKIKYLLEIKKVNPQDILCISFTNESTNSLKEKIKNPLIPVFTFHKLAIDILKKEDIYYELAPPTLLESVIHKFFQEQLYTHPFLKKQFCLLTKKLFLTKKKYLHFLETQEHKESEKLIATFISLYSTNNLTKEDFKTFFKSKNENPILFIIYAILESYQKEKEENHYYDFDDLIKKAMECCQKKKVCTYKEIIIDEFQDTSKLRLDFITTVVQNSNAHLTVVGDDFQSIYKFSGCNLNIFLNFQEYFKGAETFKLENTYRNSQELIHVAGDFVMQNKYQIKKNLKSPKRLKKPLWFCYYWNPQKALLNVISRITDGEILILGRNNFDIYTYLPKEKIVWKENGYFTFDTIEKPLRYLTIHKSKGLESDHVILINLIDGELGLPAKRPTNKILNHLQDKELFLYEEERRLFYVALTRTKNECFLLIPYLNPSMFIKEIKKYKPFIQNLYL